MSRLILALLLMAMAESGASRSGYGQTRSIAAKNETNTQNNVKLGTSVNGELTERDKNNKSALGYSAKARIALKAGKHLKISASVVGDGRKLQVELYDPTGALVKARSGGKFATKVEENSYIELGSTGVYTIVLHSAKIGPFTLLAVDPDAADATSTIDFDEEFTGELTENASGTCATTLPVALKAGQSLTISGSVTGTPRRIGFTLLDPTGKTISQVKMNPQSATLQVKQVNATGIGKIIVQSDKAGPFTLKVVDPQAIEEPSNEESIPKLKEEIRRLKAELEAKEQRLKSLESK